MWQEIFHCCGWSPDKRGTSCEKGERTSSQIQFQPTSSQLGEDFTGAGGQSGLKLKLKERSELIYLVACSGGLAIYYRYCTVVLSI